MRKIIIILLLSLFLLGLSSCTREECFLFEEMSFQGESGYFVNGCQKEKTNLVLPDFYQGKPVLGISSNAFLSNEMLEEVVFGKNIRYIGTKAFAQCLNLKKVSLNSGLEIMDYQAFTKCCNLEKVNLWETSLMTIGGWAFSECEKLEEASLPNSLKYIYPYAFQNCFSIKNIDLNEGLLWIGDGAFNHCNQATNERMVIPSTIVQIGGTKYQNTNLILGTHVFYDMATNYLETFEIASTNSNYLVIDGVLYAKDENGNPKYLIAYPDQKKDLCYTMPSSLEDCYELSFGKNSYLKEIVLSDVFLIYNVKDNPLTANYLNCGNNLSTAIYCRGVVEKISTKTANPNYVAMDGILYSKDQKTLYYVPIFAKSFDELFIPFGVTNIFTGAIYYNGPTEKLYQASKISLPKSLEVIALDALDSINLSDWMIEFEENEYFQLKNNIIYQK